MAYASPADLIARVPAAAAASSDQIAAALIDSTYEIDDRVFGSMALRAHCLLAAHYLQLSGAITGGESTAVVSRSAGEISVSYASPSEAATGTHSQTSYGRQFDALARKAGHAPLTDLSPEFWP